MVKPACVIQAICCHPHRITIKNKKSLYKSIVPQVNERDVAEDLVADWDAGLELAEASDILDVRQRGDRRTYLVRHESPPKHLYPTTFCFGRVDLSTCSEAAVSWGLIYAPYSIHTELEQNSAEVSAIRPAL